MMDSVIIEIMAKIEERENKEGSGMTNGKQALQIAKDESADPGYDENMRAYFKCDP